MYMHVAFVAYLESPPPNSHTLLPFVVQTLLGCSRLDVFDTHCTNYISGFTVSFSKYSFSVGVSNEVVLKSFGQFFFITCKKSGHSSMLRTLGHDLYGFLMNLDSLHDHLAFTFTKMRAPSFRCEKTPTGLILHYHSLRAGLDSIVCGIVQEVAKDFYNIDVTVTRIHYEQNTTSLPHHYVFSIEATENTDENLERKNASKCVYVCICVHMYTRVNPARSSLITFRSNCSKQARIWQWVLWFLCGLINVLM